MFDKLVGSTTVPVLEQVVAFSQARHNVLAGNIANLDTPGYQVRDIAVDDFQQRLREAISAQRQPPTVMPQVAGVSPGELGLSPGEMGVQPSQSIDNLASVAENSPTIMRHDEVNVGMESQVTEMAKNQMEHNLALALMTAQFRLLNVAISERV